MFVEPPTSSLGVNDWQTDKQVKQKLAFFAYANSLYIKASEMGRKVPLTSGY